MDNHNLVKEYVESKIAQCVLEDRKYAHSFVLGSLESRVALMLSRLEVYHPEAYITAVEEFNINEGEE